jgi:hypothetical protein
MARHSPLMNELGFNTCTPQPLRQQILVQNPVRLYGFG